MAEKIVSPGVFTRENDLSQVQAGVEAIGAAVVGPTARGPVLMPKKITSYAEYVECFGEAYESGSSTYQFFTSVAAKEYLKHNAPLTVVRVAGDGYAKASSSFSGSGAGLQDGIPTTGSGDGAAAAGAVATGSFNASIESFTTVDSEFQFNVAGTAFRFLPSDPNATPTDASPIFYFPTGSDVNSSVDQLQIAVNAAAIGVEISSSDAKVDVSASAAGVAGNSITVESGSGVTAATLLDTLEGGINAVNDFTSSFKIKTLGEGTNLNSAGGNEGVNGVLTNGSKHNFRWEITSANKAKGTFNLLVRRGDDTHKRKTILEQFTGLTMDPNSPNYIGQRIGTQEHTVKGNATEGFYLSPNGSYPNRSKYIFVDEASIQNIPNYLDENGTIQDAAAALTASSFPKNCSGSFAGGLDGDLTHPMKFYNDIEATNVQGLNPQVSTKGGDAYKKALGLLTNPDEFDINVISTPGLVREAAGNTTTIIDTSMVEACENRGDCIAVVDPVFWDKNIADATAQADALDSSYAAMYWPWIQIPNTVLGNYIWVPQSTVIPAIYAQSDALAHEWFAPAGLNRGGIEIAIQAERKLTHANRDTLYEANVNPVATFPGEGVVVFGQKTLQKKLSALDRVNVRRLLINLKKFIAGVSKFLVFENNTAATRNRFLAQVEPYMQTVQEQQGLFAFRVQMDDNNNTPDVIDRNQMRGAIFLQPAKAAEFIIIDFNIMPTGATFDD